MAGFRFMDSKSYVTLTQARKSIFTIADEVQKSGKHFTLTERGVPRAVIISAQSFERMIKNGGQPAALADKSPVVYGQQHVFPGTLVIRDDSRVVYLSGQDLELKKKEEDLIKAQLFVKLIEEYKYPVGRLELCRYVRVGGKESRHYVEADVLVNDENGNVESIFEVGSFSEYENNLDSVVNDLFALAQALSWSKKPQNLVYYSRKYTNGRAQEKISVIDYCSFNSFAAWKKAGRPRFHEIPRYGS